MAGSADTFESRDVLDVGGREHQIHRLAPTREIDGATNLPYSLRVLLENLLRHEDGETVTADDIRRLATWDPQAKPSTEIAFRPSRVLLQDFTGVPAVVDLAAMRDAMVALGGDPTLINPLQPAQLVIDHSVQVDQFGGPGALAANAEIEFRRNRERYAFLRWGQAAFDNFEVVPPATGIVHQVNVEYLARVVFTSGQGPSLTAYPDTLVGTDSHTTMVNGLGVLGWGVGGIEAEAAMLGQPVSMLIPQVVGFRLEGALPEGATATDAVLMVVEILRKKGVVGKFVEFFGPGLASLPLADRATIANMAPEYGATCGFFPVDPETLRYLELTGRDPAQVALVEAYSKAQGLFFDPKSPDPSYSDTLTFDLADVEPSIAGPKRPQDRIALGRAASAFAEALPALLPPGADPGTARAETVEVEGSEHTLEDGSVVIAAITSCTNTSNPSVMMAAGLLAKKAVERGLTRKPWVKTSLAPGSKVVTRYLDSAGLTSYLEKLGFHTVGYGCTTCIGNSGPLPPAIQEAFDRTPMVLASVLSGNRNFEGRIHADVRANYLMSPPLVVAYALTGRIDHDITTEPLGQDQSGEPVYLRDLWPTPGEVADAIGGSINSSMFADAYADVAEGPEAWRTLPIPEGQTFAWDGESTYVRHPPYFEGMGPEPDAVEDIADARVLAMLGDSVTTDHISPAGAIADDVPAGAYLSGHGVGESDYNSYGSRRGNHEVMMRGTFANVRLRNQLAPGTEGGITRHLPDGEQMTIFAASEKYRADGVATVVIAGKEYGTGSSRDWAGKGPALLGVRAVLAESYERIHRSNLVGMGVAPLQFLPGEGRASHGLDGEETYAVAGLRAALDQASGERRVTVRATSDAGEVRELEAILRIDTPQEAAYYEHGGILRYVLRQLLRRG